MTTPWFVLVSKWKEIYKRCERRTKKKPTNHRECEYYAFCIGVFWLCAGNDRLDVLPLGGGHPWLCGLLRRRPWLHTVDDNGGTVLAGSPAQCHGHCGAGQLDGQLCGWHWIPQHEGWPAERVRSVFLWTETNIVFFFQTALENYTFLPFSVFLAIFWIFTYKKVPETKNKTFEEILALFRHNNGRYVG